MINLLVDEMAITLDYNSSILKDVGAINYFNDYALLLEQTLYLDVVLGDRERSQGGLLGYDTVINWGYDNKQVRYLYSFHNSKMKMQLRFGASALRNYINQYKLVYGKDISVLDILKSLDSMSDLHAADSKIRLSRIDIAFDFIDEDIYVPYLYNRLLKDDLAIFNKRNMRVNLNAFNGEQSVNTLYFNKRSSASMLRIYNKKIEQLTRKDSEKFKLAFNCNTWTRFELELKQYYAHNITAHILSCKDNNELQSVLAQSFIDCFKIREFKGYDSNQNEIYENTLFYEDMILFAHSTDKLLMSHSYQQLTDFDMKYQNLFKNGTMPFFKMIQEAYGDEALEEFFDKIKEDLEDVPLDKKQETIIQQNKNAIPFFRN